MMKITVAVVAVLLAAVMAFAQNPFPPAPIKLVWESMFAPGTINGFNIALAMDCVTANQCYIAGGEASGVSQGVGQQSPFGIFLWDGKMEGQINRMPDNNMSMIVMDVAVSGTASNPTGVFSSVTEFGISKALQYLQGGTTWSASLMPFEFVWASQSVAADPSGKMYIAVGSGITGNAMMVSTDGGAVFAQKTINFKPPAGRMTNCSFPGDITIVSGTTWYLTWGNEPPQNNGGSSSSASSSFSGMSEHALEAGVDAKYLKAGEIIIKRQVQGRVLVIKNTRTGAVRQEIKSILQWREDLKTRSRLAADSQCNFYAGYILKTTDAGNSWRIVYENQNANPGLINCYDEQHCALTAFNADESYTIITTNGENFKITYTTPPASKTQAEQVSAVGYASQTELWVAGSIESQAGGKGLFWSSDNSGETFKPYSETIPQVMVILAMDFADGVGFALGLTQYKQAEILRYKKQADYGNFQQKQCPIAGCTFLCQTMYFPQGVCLMTQGGSAKAFCQNNQLVQYAYDTTSCVGKFKKYAMPVNVCLNSTAGNFFENICPSSVDAKQPLAGLKTAGKFLSNL